MSQLWLSGDQLPALATLWKYQFSDTLHELRRASLSLPRKFSSAASLDSPRQRASLKNYSIVSGVYISHTVIQLYLIYDISSLVCSSGIPHDIIMVNRLRNRGPLSLSFRNASSHNFLKLQKTTHTMFKLLYVILVLHLLTWV